MKPKRTRRTKAEMIKFRSSLVVEEGEDILKPKKASPKSNLNALDYVYDVETKELKEATKIIEGWVNVFADTRGGYFIGCDIHYTSEEAKAVGDRCSRTCLKPIYISFTIKE